MSSKDLPQIRKAIFIVDKNRRYAFDVNQNINIYKLKKMLIAASNLGKIGLRIFHEGVEYTDRDPDCLDELFPDLQVVEFTLKISYENKKDYDNLFEIQLNKNYCPLHEAKYPYFYCYDCKKSICSKCMTSGEHDGHNTIEKYDYLQSSSILIEKMFSGLKLNLEKVSDDRISGLKKKISIEFFPRLVEMVKQIEGKLIGLVDMFVEKQKGNVEIIKTNLTKLKEDCREGLDELKNKIVIEDLMIDEEVFLTFDKKFKDLEKEKEKFKNELEKSNEYSKKLTEITNSVNKIYGDIYAFLLKYLNDKIYDDIKKIIDENVINPIDKQNILYVLLSDIKKKDPFRLYSQKKVSKFNIHGTSPKMDEIEEEHFSDAQEMEAPQGMDLEEDYYHIPKKPKITSTTFRNNSNNVFICQPIPNTLELLVYSMDKESITRKKVKGSSLTLSAFPEKAAWYNHNNILYISGGYINNKPSSGFFAYDPNKNTLTRLQDMPQERYSHSLCIDDSNNLYVIGGNSKMIFKYNIDNLTWSKVPYCLSMIRYQPILFMKDNTIYVFFGTDSEGTIISSVEKGKTLSKGEFYIVNDEKIKLVNAGLVESDKNYIIFFGGKNENGNALSSALKYDLNRNKFEESQFSLNEGASFQQGVMPKIKDDTFGNFCLEAGMSFIKINFS